MVHSALKMYSIRWMSRSPSRSWISRRMLRLSLPRQVTHLNAKCLSGVSHFGIGFDHFRSFDTKSAPRISREPFGIESSNLTRASIPKPHRIWRHYLLPDGSYSEKNSQKRFKLGSRNFTHLSRTIDPTNIPEMTSLAASGRLQMLVNTAQKCAKRVRPDKESNN